MKGNVLWLISFGDLLTLLVCFFVLLISNGSLQLTTHQLNNNEGSATYKTSNNFVVPRDSGTQVAFSRTPPKEVSSFWTGKGLVLNEKSIKSNKDVLRRRLLARLGKVPSDYSIALFPCGEKALSNISILLNSLPHRAAARGKVLLRSNTPLNKKGCIGIQNIMLQPIGGLHG